MIAHGKNQWQKMKHKILLILLILIGYKTYAQTPLTLSQAIYLAQTNSLQTQLNKNSFEIGNQNYKNQFSQLLPQVNLTGNLPGYNNSISSITQPDGTIKFTTIEQAYSSGNVSLNQKIFATGGTLNFSSGLNRFDRLSGVKTTNWQAQSLLINLNQPIFQFNNLKFSQQINKLNLQLNSKTYIENNVQLALQVTQQFFATLVAFKNLEIAEYNQLLNDTLYKKALTKFKLGKIGEEELLQIELQTIGNISLVQSSKANYNYQINLLKILLNTEEIGSLQIEHVNPKTITNEQELLTAAEKNRSDLFQNSIDLATQLASVKKAQLTNLPNFTLNASYGLNQQAVLLPDAYQNSLPQQMASVALNMPLLSFGGNGAKIKMAQLQLENQRIKIQQAKFALAANIKKQIADYNLAQLNLNLAFKMDTIAQRRFNIALKKYNVGVITYQDLFIAQQQQNQAQIGLYQAHQNYWVAYYTLQKNTLYDLEKEKVLE